MSDIKFEVDSSIYREDGRGYLTDSRHPDEIVGREDVLEQYRDALLPVVNGEDPDSIFVYGKSGTGKTECTRYILKKLENAAERSRHVDSFRTITVSCEGLTTSYMLAVKLINTLRDQDNQISRRGHGEKFVYETLLDELEAIGGTVLLVLDELDNIDSEELNGILYQIPRARQNGYLDDTKVGLIGISNDFTLLRDLRADVESSLAEKSIQFDPYDNNELKEVVEQRAEQAFLPEAVPDKVIEACAAFGTQDGGDARTAIQLLREAGDMARGESSNEVTVDHVKRAQEKLEEQRVVESISDLSMNERITLYALVTLLAERDEPPRSKEVSARYQKLAKSGGKKLKAYRTVRDYLKTLNSMQITNRDGETGGREGNFRTHELNDDISIETAIDELESVIDECGLHSSVMDVPTAPDL